MIIVFVVVVIVIARLLDQLKYYLHSQYLYLCSLVPWNSLLVHMLVRNICNAAILILDMERDTGTRDAGEQFCGITLVSFELWFCIDSVILERAPNCSRLSRYIYPLDNEVRHETLKSFTFSRSLQISRNPPKTVDSPQIPLVCSCSCSFIRWFKQLYWIDFDWRDAAKISTHRPIVNTHNTNTKANKLSRCESRLPRTNGNGLKFTHTAFT